MMNVQIGLHSVEGKVSTFYFTLKVDKSTEHESDKEVSKNIHRKNIVFSKIHVLIVKDNKVNQSIAAMMLKKNGYQVDIADNGLQAVEKCEKKSYQIILMDV